MSDFSQIMKLMMTQGTGNGPVGTPQEPWNPASKMVMGGGAKGGGVPASQTMPQAQPPQAWPQQAQRQPFGVTQFDDAGQASTMMMPRGPGPTPQSGGFMNQLGNAFVPKAMNAMSGKGGGIG